MTPAEVDQMKENVAKVKERLNRAAAASCRRSEDIRLIAVTKYVDSQVTRNLVELGCHCLGESRPQLLWEKGEKLQDLEVEWHLIGHLQRNKIRRSLLFADTIHSCDSLKLLHAINAIAAETKRRMNCLLQVNISGESAKQGFALSELEAVVVEVQSLSNIQLNGLMGMGSLGGDLDVNRKEFSQLRELLEKLQSHNGGNVNLRELSMGMSSDFEVAIEEGATMVRVGSTMFDGLM